MLIATDDTSSNHETNTHLTYLVKLLIIGRDAKEKVYQQCFSSKMTYCTITR